MSSLETYAGTAAYASYDGAKEGMSFCMVPYTAELGVAMYAPYGMPIAGTFVSSETLLGAAMVSGYTVTASNMAVKVNDYSAGVIDRNIMEDAFGQENYQTVKSASQFGSDTIFMMGLFNPNLYSRNNDTGNIRQNAMYDSSEGGSGTQGVGNPVAVEGRGNTGRTIPNTLNEQMAMHQVQSNSLEGATKVPLEMTDPRWPASEGWIKMQSVVQNADGTKTTIHFLYNVLLVLLMILSLNRKELKDGQFSF